MVFSCNPAMTGASAAGSRGSCATLDLGRVDAPMSTSLTKIKSPGLNPTESTVSFGDIGVIGNCSEPCSHHLILAGSTPQFRHHMSENCCHGACGSTRTIMRCPWYSKGHADLFNGIAGTTKPQQAANKVLSQNGYGAIGTSGPSSPRSRCRYLVLPVSNNKRFRWLQI